MVQHRRQTSLLGRPLTHEELGARPATDSRGALVYSGLAGPRLWFGAYLPCVWNYSDTRAAVVERDYGLDAHHAEYGLDKI